MSDVLCLVAESRTKLQKLSEAWQSRLELSRNLITLVEQFLSARNEDHDLPDLISTESHKLRLVDTAVSEEIRSYLSDVHGQANITDHGPGNADLGHEASLAVADLLSIADSIVTLVSLSSMAEELRVIREKKEMIQHAHADLNMQVHAAQSALSDMHNCAIIPLQQVFLIVNRILAEDGSLPSVVESIVMGFTDLEPRIASVFPDDASHLKALCREGVAIVDTCRLILDSCAKIKDMTSNPGHDYAQLHPALCSEEKELESQLLNLSVVSKWRQNVIVCVSNMWKACEDQVQTAASKPQQASGALVLESRHATLQKAERAVRLVAGRLDSPAPTTELITRATQEENLAQMFEGWGAWI